MTEQNFNSYNDKVMKRFLKPKNFGKIKNPDGTGSMGNQKCGDIMEISFKLGKDKKKIKEIRFQTWGCGAAIAASDALCEIAKAKTLSDAKKITNKDIIENLGGLPNVKLHCSVLGAGALHSAIKNYEGSKKK
ncbi:Iron-sulfur cluster assembly scaffold protein IscU 2 [uncultured archaeon]|nr:Iron-sulfur cluster assembly scaffold protein IscU 2 [uncultured archaeon]